MDEPTLEQLAARWRAHVDAATAARDQLYDAVLQGSAAGMTGRHIAKVTGCHRNTISGWLKSARQEAS